LVGLVELAALVTVPHSDAPSHVSAAMAAERPALQSFELAAFEVMAVEIL